MNSERVKFAIQSILDWMAEREDEEIKKPIAIWVCGKGQRGRVPNWVLKQTGLKSKQEILRKYGDGYTFTK